MRTRTKAWEEDREDLPQKSWSSLTVPIIFGPVGFISLIHIAQVRSTRTTSTVLHFGWGVLLLSQAICLIGRMIGRVSTVRWVRVDYTRRIVVLSMIVLVLCRCTIALLLLRWVVVLMAVRMAVAHTVVLVAVTVVVVPSVRLIRIVSSCSVAVVGHVGQRALAKEIQWTITMEVQWSRRRQKSQ